MIKKTTTTRVTSTRVTNANGLSPQATACKSTACSLLTATGINNTKTKSEVDGGVSRYQHILVSCFIFGSHGDRATALSFKVKSLYGNLPRDPVTVEPGLLFCKNKFISLHGCSEGST